MRAKDVSENPYRDAMIKAYQKKMKEIVAEQMEKDEPFLHMLISEKRNGADDTIILAGGMRNGKLPANPQVLRWFAGELQKKLNEDNIIIDGKPVKVKINMEGEPVCGARVHVERRRVLSDTYQFIKGRVPTHLLKGENGKKVVNVFAEMAREFQEQFPDKKSLEEFLQTNTTEEDRNRLEGKMYYKDGLQASEEVGKGQIAMSSSLRRAFAGGLKTGDMVYVYDANNLDEQGNPKVKVALEIIPAKVKNRSEDEKVGYRKPAVNQDTINNLGSENRNIIVEKK